MWGDSIDRAIRTMLVLMIVVGAVGTLAILWIANYLGQHLIIGWKP